MNSVMQGFSGALGSGNGKSPKLSISICNMTQGTAQQNKRIATQNSIIGATKITNVSHPAVGSQEEDYDSEYVDENSEDIEEGDEDGVAKMQKQHQ